MSAEAFLIDANIRRQIMAQRFSNSVWQEIKPILEEVAEKIKRRLREADSELRRSQLAPLLQDIQSALDEGKAGLDETLRERIIEFGQDQAEFQKQTFEQITDERVEPVPEESLTGEIMTVGLGLLVGAAVVDSSDVNQTIDRLFDRNTKDIKNTVSTGFIAKRSSDDIARQVDQKVGQRMVTQSRVVASTLVNHSMNVAKNLFAKANRQLIKEERYVAVLDARTTMRCAGLDGQVFEIESGPQPPLHYNCRSVRVSITRPEIISNRFQGNRTAFGIGDSRQTVPPGTTFSTWLRDQPVEFRDEFFSKFTNGAEKRKLFDYGGLNPNDFIDPSGAQMNLTELREKYPTAWQQANI